MKFFVVPFNNGPLEQTRLQRASYYLKFVVCLLVCFLPFLCVAQTTFFAENIGTPSATTAIASHAFQNASPIVFSGTADVRNTIQSNAYAGASGAGNIFFGVAGGNAKEIIISGINTALYTNISVSFGVLSSTANNMLTVEYSTNGSTFNALSVNTTINANTWTLKSSSATIPSSSNLYLKFSKNSGTSFRLDDIKLLGTLINPPTLWPDTLSSALFNTYGTPQTAALTFSVNGVALNGTIIITPSTGFEVSVTNAVDGFSAFPLNVTPGVNNAWIRASATKTVGSFDTTICAVLSGAGAVSPVNIITSANGNAVVPKLVSISGLAGIDKTYDGTSLASVMGVPNLNGVLANDTVFLSGTPIFTFNNANAGTMKPIAFSGYALTGAQANNYILLSETSLTANITKANQVVYLNPISNKMLSDASFPLMGNASSGLPVHYESSDTSIVKIVNDTAFIQTAGMVFITARQLGNINYNSALSVSDTVQILLQALNTVPVISSNLLHQVVYRTNSPAYTIQATNAPASFNAVGLPAGLSINQNTGLISGATTVAPGQYTVTVSATNQQGTGNAYLLITVLPKPLTVAGISVPSKVYDATTIANVNGTPILVGIVQNDNVTISGTISAQYATKNVGNNIVVSVSGLTLSGTKASCYTLSNPTLLGNITPRTVSVSGLIIPEKVFDGTTSASIAGTPILIGKMSNDSLNANMLNAIATFTNPNYGYNKPINISGIVFSGTDSANYTITQPNNLVSSIICDQPAIVSITSTGNSSQISWTSSGAISYTFSYKELGTPSWITISTSDTSTSINGLKASTTYEYRLRLSCTPNVNSNWLTGQFSTNSGCGLPSLNTPTSISGNLATVSWSSTADSGFLLFLRPLGATVWGASYWSNTTTRQFTNLTPNTNYEYTVRSFCKNGDISENVLGQFITTAGCSATNINTPLTVTGSTVHLLWTGNTDSVYQIALKPSTSPDWTMFVYTSNTNRVITGLLPNTNYSYAIRALCASGDQGAWAYGQVTTTAGCGVPVLLAPSPINGNSALINWTGSSDSVFQINFKISTSPLWNATVYSTSTSEWLTNLLPNTSYDYRIRSVCQNNDQSVWVNGTFTTTNTCGALTLNAPVTITSQSAVLSWNGSTDSVYNIFIRPVGAANWGARHTTSNTIRQFNNLTPNTNYEYRIRSVCKNKDVSAWVFGQFTTNNSKGITDTAVFEILNFEGVFNANNNIELSWITLNETEGNTYIVEHSANQAPFELIAQVNAKASANSDPNDAYQYQVSHTNPKEGLHQYRIRIKSIDGTYRLHSEWVEVNVMWFISNVQVYPNPAVNEANLTFTSPINNQLTYQLRDLAGRLIKTIALPINQGENHLPIDLSNMPNGVYMLQLNQSNQTIQTLRLTVSH